MSEYQEAEREIEREARRETGRTGAAFLSESGTGATEEHPVWRARQVMSKHPRASTSPGEPSSKKAKKGSEVEASARMPKIIPHGAEEQEVEEEEEEAAPTLRPRGLRSRDPTILAEGEPAGESAMAKGVERPEEVVERVEVEIPGVSTQPGTSSAQERGRGTATGVSQCIDAYLPGCGAEAHHQDSHW